jgi:hypothetical protein
MRVCCAQKDINYVDSTQVQVKSHHYSTMPPCNSTHTCPQHHPELSAFGLRNRAISIPDQDIHKWNTIFPAVLVIPCNATKQQKVLQTFNQQILHFQKVRNVERLSFMVVIQGLLGDHCQSSNCSCF